MLAFLKATVGLPRVGQMVPEWEGVGTKFTQILSPSY